MYRIVLAWKHPAARITAPTLVGDLGFVSPIVILDDAFLLVYMDEY